jgi:ribosomal protein uL13
METVFIDASGCVYGRLCSFAAKQAMGGNEVRVVNSEKIVITGNENDALIRLRALRAKGGHSQKGPKVAKAPEKILKRGIKGMLPDFRKGQGKIALKKVKCYSGIPEEFAKKKLIKVFICKSNKMTSLGELSRKL